MTKQHESLEQFTAWACAQLGVNAAASDDADRNEAADELPSACAAEIPVERLFGQLHDQALNDRSGVLHAQPSHQPQSVHEICGPLFSAYTVDNGQVHLAGCTLEDRPFLRLTYRCENGDVEHEYLTEAGQPVAPTQVTQLGLDDLAAFQGKPPKVDAELKGLVQQFVRGRVEQDGHSKLAVNVRPVATLIWCRFAEGKLHFAIGDASEELPFSGWAQTLPIPPFVCPHTGTETRHLAATDDGRITACDQIGVCAESGRRVLVSELVTCSVTGRAVLGEFVETCPVSGQPVLKSAMTFCATCRQPVSRTVIDAGACLACRSMTEVTEDDPRIARLLGEYPRLDRWGVWAISETTTAHLVTAQGWLRKLLLVVEKDSLQTLHMATGNRLSARWTSVEPSQQERILGA